MAQSIELGEYDTRRVVTAPPTIDDQRLAERLSAGGDLQPRLLVQWWADGTVQVTASSWIGVVRFSHFEVRVVPKLVGGSLRVLRMLEYTSGVRLLAHLPVERDQPSEGRDLFDLIVMLLAKETRVLVHEGLIRDYRPVNDSLDVMRGQLRLREQYFRRYGALHLLECRFDEYDGDIPENQLLAAALAVARSRVQDPHIRTETQLATHWLEGVCTAPNRNADWYRRRITYGRRNDRYRPAHELAYLVLQGLAFADLFDSSSRRMTTFMLNMNAIFEQFVSQLVEESLADTVFRVDRLRPQHSAVIVDDATDKTYSRIRPDIVIVDTIRSRTIPIDVKYKLYDLKKFSAADIYQLFLYAYALGADAIERIAGLIYPQSSAPQNRG
ncbi:McrC family protein [Mycolicibacterium elephantis]|nr:hypothetical protein [Mycolicibacterium elephantis]